MVLFIMEKKHKYRIISKKKASKCETIKKQYVFTFNGTLKGKYNMLRNSHCVVLVT